MSDALRRPHQHLLLCPTHFVVQTGLCARLRHRPAGNYVNVRSSLSIFLMLRSIPRSTESVVPYLIRLSSQAACSLRRSGIQIGQ